MKSLYPLITYKNECFQEYHDECSLVLWCHGCNWNCDWCSLKDIIYDEKNIIDEEYLPLIAHTTAIETAVVFLGGEPTIHKKGLYIGCSVAKDAGLKTKIFTNGSNPHVIMYLIERGLLDAVSLDYKSYKDKLLLLRLLPKDFNTEIRITLHDGIDEMKLILMKQKADKIFPNVKIFTQNLI